MSTIKQLLINNMVPLPIDICDIIKSFCFHDTKLTDFIKEIKKQIVIKFERALYTRKNGFVFGKYESDTSEPWNICLDDFEYREDIELYFEATNCKSCGNYITVGNGVLNNKIKCFCN